MGTINGLFNKQHTPASYNMDHCIDSIFHRCCFSEEAYRCTHGIACLLHSDYYHRGALFLEHRDTIAAMNDGSGMTYDMKVLFGILVIGFMEMILARKIKENRLIFSGYYSPSYF